MTHVVDTSALMAVLLGERGADQVLGEGRCLHLSVVNLGEIYTKVVERGGEVDQVDAWLRTVPVRIRAFRDVQAAEVARLRPLTRHLGLSFGDRVCLALGGATCLPILTADRDWAKLDLDLDIRLIR